MKVTKEDLIGDIKDFPIEIVQKMCDYQVKQGRVFNPKVFQNNSRAAFEGFHWSSTMERYNFWDEVILKKNFDLFFERYPKEHDTFKERVMLVSDKNDINKAIKRVVFAKKNDIYIAWVNAETIEESKEQTIVSTWDYAWELSERIHELTIDANTASIIIGLTHDESFKLKLVELWAKDIVLKKDIIISPKLYQELKNLDDKILNSFLNEIEKENNGDRRMHN